MQFIRLSAQTFKSLYTFPNGAKGSNPYAGLTLSGNTLYGTTANGGTNALGMVFSVNTNGTCTCLHNFNFNDGANPQAGLILSGDTLYGTASAGAIGSNSFGTVFSLNTNGTDFTVRHVFDYNGNDGVSPDAGLILSGNTLYGTTSSGGTNAGNPYPPGTIFALNTNGSNFTILHDFSAMAFDYGISTFTNNDGAFSCAGLALSGDTLYGTTRLAGSSGGGTVFSIDFNGTLTTLHNFAYIDGGEPSAGLIPSGAALYGTTHLGGSNNRGTIFAISTNGMDFAVLHSFTGNSGGATPLADLILSGDTLYGTTAFGGTNDNGTVFSININGANYKVLYTFTGGSDGAHPYGNLTLLDNTLYGTTEEGGSSGGGTVFSLALPPPLLAARLFSNQVIVTWSTNYTGFILQAATNLVPSAVWNTISPVPVVVNGQNTVTNPISGEQIYYRLIK